MDSFVFVTQLVDSLMSHEQSIDQIRACLRIMCIYIVPTNVRSAFCPHVDSSQPKHIGNRAV